VNGGMILDRAVRTAGDWRVLAATLLGSVVAFVAQTGARYLASSAGLLPPDAAPWSIAPQGAPPSVAAAYALVFFASAIAVKPFTHGLGLHAAALHLADEKAQLATVWRKACHTWGALVGPVAIVSCIGQIALAVRIGGGPSLLFASGALQLVALVVGLWSTLAMIAVVVTGAGFRQASSSALHLLRTSPLPVLGAALLLGIPAAMLAIAVIAMVALPGFGDVMRSAEGLPQTLLTLAVMPVLTAFTNGGFIALYVQLTAPVGTQEEA